MHRNGYHSFATPMSGTVGPMATKRVVGPSLEMKAYAGTNPATGKKEWLYDRVPATAGKREIDRVARALDARADAVATSRRERRRDPHGTPKKKAVSKTKTVGEAVEAWWKHHGSKLAGAPKTRSLIDGIIIPHLGSTLVALVAGTPPDDEDDRDEDLVYLSEKWAAIQKTGRKVGDEPLEASTIHKAHGIVGAALRRAGHPITDPGLPTIGAVLDTTPLPEEMVAFLPHLSDPGSRGEYMATRRVRKSDKIITYKVAARPADPSAMDLMLEVFALLVGSGPRPVEAAAITRAELDLDSGVLALAARGVVIEKDDGGPERWVIVTGETTKRRRRTVTLDSRTIAAARRWFKFQDEYALACGVRLSPRALVFSLDNEAKEPISPKVMSKAFERAVDRARVAGCDLPDGFHLYSMRHFGITQLLRGGKGRNVAAVAERFGTSTRMIESRYEHAIQKDDAHLADILGAVWGDTDPPEGTVLPLR